MSNGYPGNGQFPKNYLVVTVTTQSMGNKHEKIKRTGRAYWSGKRWIGVDGFRVSSLNSKVIKWAEIEADEGGEK